MDKKLSPRQSDYSEFSVVLEETLSSHLCLTHLCFLVDDDGGVFVCLLACFMQMDYPLLYTQEHISRFRKRVAGCILQNEI